MSATGRGALRHSHDAYETPPWVTRRLLERIHLKPGGRWLEPCAGMGSIVRTVQSAHKCHTWDLVEIRQTPSVLKALKRLWDELECVRKANVSFDDFLKWRASHTFDVAISNPPYVNAFDIIDRCLTMSDMVIMLLRLNWLESATRQKWIREHMPDVYVLPTRPSFKGNGKTDATGYAWMVWPKGNHRRRIGRVELLAPTPLAERQLDEGR